MDAKNSSPFGQLLKLDMCTLHIPEGNFSQYHPYVYFEGEKVGKMTPTGVEWDFSTPSSVRNHFEKSDWGLWWNAVSDTATERGIEMPPRHIDNLRNPQATPTGLILYLKKSNHDFSWLGAIIPPDRDYDTNEKWFRNCVHWVCEVSAALGRPCELPVLFPGRIPYDSLQTLKKVLKHFKFSKDTKADEIYSAWEQADHPNRVKREEQRLTALEKAVKEQAEKENRELQEQYVTKEKKYIEKLESLQKEIEETKHKIEVNLLFYLQRKDEIKSKYRF